MQFLALFTLLASAAVTSAMPSPAEGMMQISCIGLNDRQCSNSTLSLTCCPPLQCGSDARCH
ncbi:hypothetical protein BDV18DRAFT_163554 [Aspergillus unguis]